MRGEEPCVLYERYSGKARIHWHVNVLICGCHICLASCCQSPQGNQEPLLHSGTLDTLEPVVTTQWLRFNKHQPTTEEGPQCSPKGAGPSENKQGRRPRPSSTASNSHLLRKMFWSWVNCKLFSKVFIGWVPFPQAEMWGGVLRKKARIKPSKEESRSGELVLLEAVGGGQSCTWEAGWDHVGEGCFWPARILNQRKHGSIELFWSITWHDYLRLSEQSINWS